MFDYFPIGYVEVIIWKVCGLHHDLFNRYGFSVSDHGYVPPVVRIYRACSHAPPITRFVTTDASSGAGTAFSSGDPVFSPGF
jgi:hypothetical protein